ncbi:MAG: hypothetical protein EOR11_20095 [Mesorhizobium sp.]|uniref:hypothetical protein n=1 Tax=Mesorhizobium sp. TaxID=1871066 RepID=UPI000FE61B45|nr:hypothetical protein [Mesorhizobium sp.]RWP84764.1 MAG: hypothetical protein EOR11_20095 [Mesorhizobium sp.]
MEYGKKQALRLAARMAIRRMRQQFGYDLPPLDNTMAKMMGLPHQGNREMARRAKRMAQQAEG